ncbi:MAG: LysR family transcriptional regulator [Sneathiella sp.]|nr:LysR family transcriptional regulator [Sneathiella sp.]
MSEFEFNTLPPMEWLRSFEAAGRNGNFTAAANEIGLTQASVSQHIRALEEKLDILLFRRLPRGVELTADGEAYLPHIENALAVIKRGTADLFGRPRRKITIASPSSVSSLWVAPRLTTMSLSSTSLEISLSSVYREVDYDAVDSDYQIRYGNGHWPDRDATLLYTEALAPACAPDLLDSIEDGHWQSLPFLTVKGSRDGWREWAKARDIRPVMTSRFRFDSFITALHAAEVGAGVVLASLPLIQTHLKRQTLTLLDPKPHVMSTGAWITWPHDRLLDKYHDELINFLRSTSN